MSDFFERSAHDDTPPADFFDEFGLDDETPAEKLARELAEADLDLIDTLRRVREHRKLSQAQLGAVMGVSQATVSSFESCSAEPKLSTVRRYAHALNVRVVHTVLPIDTSLSDLFSFSVEATFVTRKRPNAEARSYPVVNSKRTDFALGA